MSLVLSQIFIYPIKSLGGISVASALVQERGLQYDRRWLLVDEENQFLTQRKFAEMALLQVTLLPDGLQISHKIKNTKPLFVPLVPTTQHQFWVNIWDDMCLAIEVSAAANKWFSDVFGRFCRLVFMPDTSRRPVDSEFAFKEEIVSFADGFPLIVIGQESLHDLNQRLPEPVPMNRFRPSLVFTGGSPYEEDTWQNFTIGNLPFKGVKPCLRCVVTTINQQTAEKGLEPLRTLSSYRQRGNKVSFGQNVLPMSPGSIVSVGDSLVVQSYSS